MIRILIAKPGLDGHDKGAKAEKNDPLFQSEANDNHLYRNPEYSWEDYIQA